MTVLSAFCGCDSFGNRSGTSNPGSSDPGQPSSTLDAMLPLPHGQPPISDVPMPMKYKIDEGKSRNFAVAGVRFVDHLYKGKGDKFVIKRFYEKYMVMNGWKLTSFIFAQGRVALDFEKEHERCTITIVEGGFLGHTTVSVWLCPSRLPTNRSTKT